LKLSLIWRRTRTPNELAQGGLRDAPPPYYITFVPEVSMTQTDILSLREQLQEDLMCWRDVNDLPEFVDEELCDIVIHAFSNFLNK
jgi:hypothetical protein